MKSLFPILLLAATLAAQQPQESRPAMPPETKAPPPTAQTPETANAEKARAVVQQAIQALGGQKWLNVTDLQQQGRSYSFYHGEPNSVGVLFWRFWTWPDKDRYELTKQRDVIDIYNGEKGYETTFKGTALIEPEALADYIRRREYSLEWVLRKWINEPGVAYFYEGFSVAEQKPAEKVTIINARDQSVTLYFSTDTHLPIRKTFQWRDPQDRFLNEEAEAWDNYRNVEGIMTPFSTIRYRNGETTNQRFLNSASYNPNPDSLFAATLTAPKKK